MFQYLFRFKNPAFSEEREWRLISLSLRDPDDSVFTDAKELEFRARQDRIVPVRRIQLDDVGVKPIDRVVLGPRNISPEIVIASLLKKSGFDNVEISRSGASYR